MKFPWKRMEEQMPWKQRNKEHENEKSRLLSCYSFAFVIVGYLIFFTDGLFFLITLVFYSEIQTSPHTTKHHFTKLMFNK